ncbi:MAG: glycosyltransferase [Candidatus Brocadiales bacterium]
MSTTLVILTLNEIEGITALFDQIPFDSVDQTIVIDGGSVDGTVEFFRSKGMKVIIQDVKGRGEAFRIAMREARGEHLVFFSPDGNEDPKDIPRLAGLLKEGFDMAIASRFLANARNEEDEALLPWRAWANRAFTFIANSIWGGQITDTINGYRAITKAAFQRMAPDAPGFVIEYQVSIRAMKLGLKVAETPTIEGDRIGGESTAKSIPAGLLFLKYLLRELRVGRNFCIHSEGRTGRRNYNLMPISSGVSLEHIILLFILSTSLFFRAYGVSEQTFLINDSATYSCAARDLQTDGQFFHTGAKTGYTFIIFLGYKLFGIKSSLASYIDCVFGVLTVLMMFVLARRLFDIQTALYSSAILGSSFLHIFYSKAGTGYVEMMFFLTLSIYFYYLSLNNVKSWHLLFLAGVASGFGFTFHYIMAIQLLLILFYEVYSMRTLKRSFSGVTGRFAVFSLGLCIPIVFVEAVVVYSQLFENPQKTYLTELFSNLIANFSPFSTEIKVKIRELAVSMPTVYSVDFLKGLYSIFTNNKLLDAGRPPGDFLYLFKIFLSFEGLIMLSAFCGGIIYFLILLRRGYQLATFIVLVSILFPVILWSIQAGSGGMVVPRVWTILLVFVSLLLGKSFSDLASFLQGKVKLKYINFGLLLALVILIGFPNSRQAAVATTGYDKAYCYLKGKTDKVAVDSYLPVWMFYFGKDNVHGVKNFEELDSALNNGFRYFIVDYMTPEKLSEYLDPLKSNGSKYNLLSFDNKVEGSLARALEESSGSTEIRVDYLKKIFIFKLY